MEEEFEQVETTSVQTETVTSVEQEVKTTPSSLPSIEELKKSEQQVEVNTEIEGATVVEQKTQTKDRVFKKKIDERKVYIKKRLKIVTAVYTTVVALLLGFVITNIVTLAMLNKDIRTNTDTIKAQTQQIEQVVEENPGVSPNEKPIEIELNEPRDYSEDKKELTWLDKITILFRNIFS